MVATISPAECTVAHVFEHIQKLEDQSNEELAMEIDYGTLPAPFDMRKTDEGDMKDDALNQRRGRWWKLRGCRKASF